jgi:hypothetical protein
VTSRLAGSGEPDLERLAQGARRRWLLMVGLITVGAAVGTQLVVLALGQDRQPVRDRHGGDALIAIVGPIAIVLAVVLVLAVVAHRTWRGKGMFAAPLALGIPRAQRRQANRAVREGVPSQDPTLAAVELDTAQRSARYGPRAVAMFGVCVALDLAVALLLGSTAAERALYLGSAVLFAVVLIKQRRVTRIARRYLAKAAG